MGKGLCGKKYIYEMRLESAGLNRNIGGLNEMLFKVRTSQHPRK